MAESGSDSELKLNSYDLAVDIELHDAVQRLRFEHPQVHAVILTLGQGTGVLRWCEYQDARACRARLQSELLASSQMKTRNALEDASANSGQFATSPQ